MTFNYPGYPLIFIQKQPCSDNSEHLFSLKYKFYSPKTKFWYILHADYHQNDAFAIKFYCKKDRHSEYKYSKIVNKGDLGNLIVTCAQVVPLLLAEYKTASFGFGAARSVDKNNKTVEPLNYNQRFNLYKYFAEQKFGTRTFEHFEYPQISCYLLVNRNCEGVLEKEKIIVGMFSNCYRTLPDV